MKTLNNYINEWKFNRNTDVKDMQKYNYFPKSPGELMDIIIKRLKENIESPFLSDIDTSQIDWMSALFSDYKDNYIRSAGLKTSMIKHLDLRRWDVSNVEKMEEMFYECTGLEELLISTWDTQKLDNVERMFYHCKNLKELDLQHFCTKNVKSMKYMFAQCTNLKRLDLRSFDTSSVCNMSYMFEECASLEYINASSFNTKNVDFMTRMFSNCSKLNNIEGIEQWDVTNLEKDQSIFYNCKCIPKWIKI